MGAAERLKLLPSDDRLPRPANEFQMRPFLKLAPEEFPGAWKRALKTAKEGKVTTRVVQAVIRELLPSEQDQVRAGKKGRRSKSKEKLPLAQESTTMMELTPPGGTALGVALALTDDARKLVGRHTGVTLTVQGIEQFCRDLTAAGVAFAEPLEVSPWGKMAVVTDPDGNQFALVEL